MKKGLLAIGFIAVLLAGVALLYQGMKEPTPPTPTLTVEGKQVEVGQASYCWQEWMAGVCADTVGPIDIAKRLDATVVSPEAKLTIAFDETPNADSLSVSRWLSEDEVSEVTIENGVMVLPKEKGTYIFDFSADWKKGGASYVFTVTVK